MDVLRPLTRRGVAVAAGLGLAAAVSGCAVGGSSSPAPASPSGSTVVTTSAAAPAQLAQRTGSVVPEAPVGIRLADGRKVAIRPVGTSANGLLDVPSDIGVAGWWNGGSRLGDPFGSTLVAAHVDSYTQGLGPFASLLSVRPGDRLRVWSQHLEQTYVVHSLRLRPRQVVIGPDSWLHSPDGARRLTLVTCAGPYVRSEGGYQNLAVVVAEPQGKVRERS